MKKKKIILTGGGTAGHVTPNIALLPHLLDEGYEVAYVGSSLGIEKELIEKCNIPFFPISAGKLRRYLSVKNFTDIFRVVKGLSDASKIIKREKPDVIFSKGGFVSVPVVIAGHMHSIPVVIHESDITPGLANKIAYPFSIAVCASFPETLPLLPKGKGILTGAPIRDELFIGSKLKGQAFTGLKCNKPILLITGGSQGSVKINACIREILNKLLEQFNIIHLCGKGNINEALKFEGYKQYAYINEQLPDLLALSDVVISRAGANSINEFLTLKKPNLLIPLSKNASRGDQILNADSFATQGFSRVLYEEDLTAERLFEEALALYENKDLYVKAMSQSILSNGIAEVMKIIRAATAEQKTSM